MDADKVKKLIQKHSYVENNGMILRVLNMMDAKEHKLGNIHYIMHDVPPDELRSSLHYLYDSGYIRIDHPDGAGCVGADREAYAQVKVEITHKGLDLLMGITENPAVDI